MIYPRNPQSYPHNGHYVACPDERDYNGHNVHYGQIAKYLSFQSPCLPAGRRDILKQCHKQINPSSISYGLTTGQAKNMGKTEKQITGNIGENIAARFLMKQDFVIKHKNYRKKWGEIDIVAQKGKDLRFVEVKTVSHPKLVGNLNDKKGYFRPEENIHPYKLKRLHRAIQTYLMEYNVSSETSWQLDAAIVYLDFTTHKAKVDYIENIM